MGIDTGTPIPVDRKRGSEAGTGTRGFVSPSLLPDGDRYFAVSTSANPSVHFGSVREGWLQRVMPAPTLWARFAAGHLLYVQGRRLLGRPFDVRTRTFTGQEHTVAEPAWAFSALSDGTVAYVEPQPLRQITWVERAGASARPVGEPSDYMGIALAPRSGRAVVWRPDDDGNIDLWEVDTSTGVLSRLTSAAGNDADAAWSPDERRLAFTSSRRGSPGVYLRDSETGQESVLYAGTSAMVVDGWTPDGRHIVARTLGREVFVIPVAGEARPRMVADTPFTEDETRVSPDGRWIAFHSNESGAWEIYVASFPTFASKRQVSRGGGVQPQWRGDGRELFYLAPDGAMMSVALDMSKGPVASAPERLFATNVEPISTQPQYAVTPDGKRFLLVDRGPARPNTVHVLLNWMPATPN
jgi:WD40 repeat protein